MPLNAGTRLGPYEIVAPIGAGGMGEVYRALDTRLDRTVAIKVLPELSSADADARARFEREARIVASLHHPHICTLHDVGRERPVPARKDVAANASGSSAGAPSNEIDFLVMPYLDGETLAARLKRGSLPLAEALEIARQIAGALDRAHRHDVVHRDLKPGNVMLTKSGAILLDFGLARTEPASSPNDATSGITRSALTDAGTILGTLPYMAPEQLAGQRADARSDVWAFGCLLYEMVGGRRPFDGDSQPALIGAIMASEPPPLSQARPARPPVPRAIEQVVAGALVKDREERWQHMRDVTRALAIAAVENDENRPSPAATRSRRPLAVAIGVAGVLGAMALAAAFVVKGRASDTAMVRFDVDAAGSGTILQFTDTKPYFAVSPDGSRLAYVTTVDGRQDIWVKRIDSEQSERLADTTGGTSPFWSPDGQSIAFVSGGRLKRKALGAGAAQVFCETDSLGMNGTWNRDGVVLFAEWGSARLMRVSENGGTPVMVRQGTAPIGFPEFLPDGRHFLYSVPEFAKATVHGFVGSLDSDVDTPIPGVSSRMAFAAGHLLFWREGSLVAQPFDLRTFQLTGEAVALVDQIHAFNITGYASFSVSPRLLVYQAGAVDSRLVWTNRQGIDEAAVGPVANFNSVRLSPDESSIAFSARDPRLGSNDIFIHELKRQITRPFTSDRGTENGPIWSLDGKTIVYTADRHRAPNLQSRAADGTGPEQELLPPSPHGPQSASQFTPDGRSLLFVEPNAGTDFDVMIMPIDHHAAPVAVVQTKGADNAPSLSSDGKWLAFQSNESGRTEVYVQPLYDPRGRRQVSQNGGSTARWRRDGKELFYVTGVDRRQMMAVDMTASGSTIEPGVPRLLFVRPARVIDYDVTQDGKRFLLIAPDPITERGTLSAVLNWTKLIRP